MRRAERVDLVEIQSLHRVSVAEVTSPAFQLAPPRVLNPDYIPAHILDAMRPGWFTGAFPAGRVRVTKLFDVYVTQEGLVFTQDKKLVQESITQHTPEECAQGLAQILQAEQTQSVQHVTPSSLLLRKRGEQNYGHWMVELLPKLWLAEEHLPLCSLVVPQVGGNFARVLRDSVALSTGFVPLYHPMSQQDVSFFKELVLVDGLSNHGVYMSPLAFSRTDAMVASVPGAQVRKLYLTRKNRARSIKDEDSLMDFLQEQGFLCLDPADLTLLEQIKLFKNAECVVGVMGAAMTNIMFCRKGTRVINLAPGTMPDTFFYFIAGLRGLDYYEIRGKLCEDSESWDVPFDIERDHLAHVLSLGPQGQAN
ncbi:glycosyltransferase family 61 protein [Acetobacter persici]|uniref:glycosyltransferase family 61 protein n=1 Tax=Acetobacter persici TaxID=1076596 RepID=UPI0020CE977B|nr:glycosyltransferase family 61 protein [Acetobacter persici]